MRGGRAGSLAASPTLVGAVTVLVVTVAVFLAYQANQGLPFVPTYKLSAQVPNANTLVPGNEVRVGGIRVGAIKTVEPVQGEDGSVNAKLDMELNQDVDPLPVDSVIVERARPQAQVLESARRLRARALRRADTIPLSAGTPEPVEIDQVFNTFDDPTRAAIQVNLTEFGNALAGRGQALNAAIGDRPLVERSRDAQPELSRDGPGAVSALSAAAAGAARWRSRDSCSSTWRPRSAPSPTSPAPSGTIEKSAPTEEVTIATLPNIRRSSQTRRCCSTSCGPATRRSPAGLQ
jgi:hypothetical protein